MGDCVPCTDSRAVHILGTTVRFHSGLLRKDKHFNASQAVGGAGGEVAVKDETGLLKELEGVVQFCYQEPSCRKMFLTPVFENNVDNTKLNVVF